MKIAHHGFARRRAPQYWTVVTNRKLIVRGRNRRHSVHCAARMADACTAPVLSDTAVVVRHITAEAPAKAERS